MHYDRIKNLACDQFRRLTGVQRSTFDKMVEILNEAAAKENKQRGGRKHKLSMEERLLMTLEYLREYRISYC